MDSASTAPSVVAVVVTHDPGDGFDETLAALKAQDYPDLRIVVVDTGSRDDPAPRVAQVLPDASIHKVGRELGPGAACNDLMALAGLADFFLFCHDDVAPDPGAVSALVETATTSGAGIVGPKLVSWDDPRRLLQVGAVVDKIGVAMPAVEPGELDQGQHDGVREVFEVPGACTLIRADLFAHIGGFDEEISLLCDDLSLCWRARIAGARVAVTSAARVRHRESLGTRMPVNRRRRLVERHRLRVVLTSYSRTHMLRILPQLALASLAELVISLAALRPARARAVAGAWCWNLCHLGSLRLARKHVGRFRRVDDDAVRQLQVPGLVRPQLLIQRVGVGRGVRRRAVRDRLDTWCAGWTRGGAVMLLVLAGILALGTRHLVTRGVPAVGDLAQFDRPGELIQEWMSGWRRTGLGADAAAPTAFGAFGALGTLLLGHVGILRLLVTVGLIPVGVYGAAQLLRPTGSTRAPVAAAVAYATVPVPYAALAEGRWSPLAVYAAAPWLLGRLARASGAAPFAAAPWLQNVTATGVVTALCAIVMPAAPMVLLVLAVGLALGCVLAFDLRGVARIGTTTVGGLVVAAALHLPWTLDVAGAWRTAGAWIGQPRPPSDVDWPALLVLSVGGSPTPLSLGLLAAAGGALLVGREWRVAWAVRAWVIAACGWILAAAATSGSLDVPLPPPDVFLVVVGAALALSVGLGVSVVEHDVAGRSRRLGLRRIVTAGSTAGLLVAVVPLAAASLDGYWDMPRGDFSEVLAIVDDKPASGSSRVLWLGDPGALPVPSWLVGSGKAARKTSVGFATSDGLPKLHDLWAGPADPGSERIAHAVELATTQQTARLGRLLAPMAVEYIAVPLSRAPSPFTDRTLPAPSELVEALAGQLDLERVEVDPALLLFRNLATRPERAALRDQEAVGGADSPTNLRASGEEAHVWPVLARADGYGRWVGQLSADVTMFQAVSASDRWVLEVDGERVDRTTALGWANAFDVGQGGHAVLRYDTPVQRRLLLGAQVALWVGAVVLVVRLRARAPRPETPAVLAPVFVALATKTGARTAEVVPPTPRGSTVTVTKRRTTRRGRQQLVRPPVVESVTLISARDKSDAEPADTGASAP